MRCEAEAPHVIIGDPLARLVAAALEGRRDAEPRRVDATLAALAGQAWWQNRQDRERERDYLRQLLVDTRENERRLGSAIRNDSATAAALARIVTALYAPGAPPRADSLLRLLGAPRAFGASDFQPIAGTYVALLATGDLRLIRTDSRRTRLVAYAASVDYERANLAFYQQQAFGDAGRVARSLPFLQLIFVPDAPAPRAAEVDVAQLRGDRELRGTLFAFQAANTNRRFHLGRLLDETRRLRRALEAERVEGSEGPTASEGEPPR